MKVYARTLKLRVKILELISCTKLAVYRHSRPARSGAGARCRIISALGMRFVLCLFARGSDLILKASKILTPGKLTAEIADGARITGWVAEHKTPVALARNAFTDPRFSILQ